MKDFAFAWPSFTWGLWEICFEGWLNNIAGRGGRPTARLSAEEAKFQVLGKTLFGDQLVIGPIIGPITNWLKNLVWWLITNDIKSEAWLNCISRRISSWHWECHQKKILVVAATMTLNTKPAGVKRRKLLMQLQRKRQTWMMRVPLFWEIVMMKVYFHIFAFRL